MKLGYILLYVSDVPSALKFYEAAFGVKRAFLHESNTYGEIDTGGTRLGFVAHEVAASHGFGYAPVTPAGIAPGIEIGFVSEDVAADYARAVAAGATPVLGPTVQPWGQTVSYVRDPHGLLVEICSSMG